MKELHASKLKKPANSADPRTLVNDFRGLTELHANIIRCQELLKIEGAPPELARQLGAKLQDTLEILFDLAVNIAWQLASCPTQHPFLPKFFAEALLLLGEDDPTDLCSVLTMRVCNHLAHGDIADGTAKSESSS